ncbi:MAG: 2-dehydropantoate 2-reductase [Spirochaetaceae bacterium]|nr:MAG: 2-dehydropantoate 2-reductase [Spirochaetaceae bacterium]
MIPQRIAVIGAGPVGSVLGAHLQNAGHSVVYCEVGRGRRETLSRDGVKVSGEIRLETGPATVVPSVDALSNYDPELVFIAVKANALPLICDALAAFLSESATVVSWQNGIDTEQVIAETLGRTRVLRAVINHGVVMGGADEVIVTFDKPPHYVQELNPGQELRAVTVAQVLSAAGMPTQRADDLISMVWRKGILNAALNALCALTGMNMREAWNDPYSQRLAKEILKQAITVARANEIKLGWNYYHEALTYIGEGKEHKPSMLLDLESGKRSEIDFINGKIVEYGDIAGLPTPHNRSVFWLVKAMERAL